MCNVRHTNNVLSLIVNVFLNHLKHICVGLIKLWIKYSAADFVKFNGDSPEKLQIYITNNVPIISFIVDLTMILTCFTCLNVVYCFLKIIFCTRGWI